MQTHELKQGTPEWKAHRASGYNGAPFFNASDAPAMMGCSAYKSRSALLHEMATGQVPEVDHATQRRYDDGHRFEELARPLAAKIIGEDLYPVTGSEGRYGASFDGLTMAEDIGFEHKTLNDALRDVMHADVKGFELPLQYQVQMEQQCMVSGAGRILFMASKWDGDNLVEERHCWYVATPELRAKIVAGWEQFALDLAAYVAPEVIVAPVAAPQMGLPAVVIKVEGSIALVDNLPAIGVALNAYIARINKKPESDQDFANLEATVKDLKAFEEALTASEGNALAQVNGVDAMRKTVALYRELASTNRLLVDKLVKAEKENRRIAIVSDAAAELVTHIKKLNERLDKPYMPAITADFQGVIKGLKSLDSMKDKVSTELARCKIAANEAADSIQANLTTLRELASEYKFLFADTAQLVGKANDDLTALVKSRIADHKAAEAKREEETRERIRAEEQAKAEAAAREKVAAEQAEAARVERERQEAEARAAQQAQAAAAPVVIAQAATETVAPTVTHGDVVKVMMPASVRQAMVPAAAKPTSTPTLTLSEISSRLGFDVTSAFLSVLGFEATKKQASKLYHEEDLVPICRAFQAHLESVINLQQHILLLDK